MDVGEKLKTILSINTLNILYALTLFLQTELWVNTYRVERITGWSNIGTYTDSIIFFIFILSSIWGYFLTKRKFGGRKVKYVMSISWIPYYAIFIVLFSSLFPITSPAEKPLAGVGFYIIGSWVIFPLYITLINVLSAIGWNNK